MMRISGDFVQFLVLYENRRLVLWDKNLKLPMHQFHFTGFGHPRDIFVTEDTVDMVTEFLLLIDRQVLKVQPHYEFMLYNLRFTPTDWEKLIYEVPWHRPRH